MRNHPSPETTEPDSFEQLFRAAESTTGYWVELAKLDFTEAMLARMKQAGVKKAQLAANLGAKPAFVTRLVSGHNNFTLETMVRVARALDCELRCHLQPAGTRALWLDVIRKEPQRPTWAPGEFRTVQTIHLEFTHETVAAAA